MIQTFQGIVVKGVGEAERIFGSATANIHTGTPPDLEQGVYVGWVEYNGTRYGASICYGIEQEPKLEVHILDFDEDILGKELSGEILYKISEYVRGYSTERLRQKILHDIELCREYLKDKE